MACCTISNQGLSPIRCVDQCLNPSEWWAILSHPKLGLAISSSDVSGLVGEVLATWDLTRLFRSSVTISALVQIVILTISAGEDTLFETKV